MELRTPCAGLKAWRGGYPLRSRAAYPPPRSCFFVFSTKDERRKTKDEDEDERRKTKDEFQEKKESEITACEIRTRPGNHSL